MPRVHSFHVTPALPVSLQCIRSFAFNLRWAWDHSSSDLFRRLDAELWEQTGRNPIKMLGSIAQHKLQDASIDDSFLEHLDRCCHSLDSYMGAANTWCKRMHGNVVENRPLIAYFSMEFGITECLPIYSGGLGVLAGDHLKSASDLDLPLVGVGLLYQQGYFRQFLHSDGWQQERYPDNDFYNMPVQIVRTPDGENLTISVDFPGRKVHAQVWVAQVGRIPLYLLDTNIALNSNSDVNITDQLYGGDFEMRLKQEMILGIGGFRALEAMGIKPSVCHMNEGHSAFLAMERARLVIREHGVNYSQAQEVTSAGNLFTTHTPVPAGFDLFPSDLMQKYFNTYIEELGLPFDRLMGLGRVRPNAAGEQFNVAVLALRHAHQCNGVSRLHGQVTRKMVQAGYPGFPEDEVPVSHVTNGIHTKSFIAQEMTQLFNRYLSGRWASDMSDPFSWDKIANIPDEELWRVRELLREKLIFYARDRLKSHYENRGMSEFEIRQTREILNPSILTIGFARRFATYKRATLILHEPERLIKLLNDSHRPIQLIFAGKAHPKDDGGKEYIKQIVQFAQPEDVRHRVVFLEDYDLSLARHLVQGVDVWLNTPRYLMEASGTSGMKVLPNGGLNVSVPDGWWAEGYDPLTGWCIGKGEDLLDHDYQDKVEANSLYDILEKEVVPLFYDRSTEGIPRGWISRIKNSMRMLCPVFNTDRMVAEYAERFYFPAMSRYNSLMENDLTRAKQLVEWKNRLREFWPQIKVGEVEMQAAQTNSEIKVGEEVHIAASIHLGPLNPSDVTVQAYVGLLDINHQIPMGDNLTLTWKSQDGEDHRYEGVLRCSISGMQGFSVRVLPKHPDAKLPNELALIAWE